MKNTTIGYRIKAFNCPSCGVYANQDWCKTNTDMERINNLEIAVCAHCNSYSVWFEESMIHPTSGSTPLPSQDLPESIIKDYEEARSIVEQSPRGAVALLRLCVQKLCKELGEQGDNINDDIKALVSKGLPVRMQQALDSVRVVGNNAVHPGQIDLTDDRETAYKLFGFINIITDILITQPNQIEEFYNFKVPDSYKTAIAKRDSKV